MQEFEELPTIEEFIAQNKRSPPKIRIIVRASHIESREILKEYAPFERDIYKKEYDVDINGRLVSKETGVFDHTEINFRNINNYYADWKREDEGGGKIEDKRGNPYNSFVKEVEKKFCKTWLKEADYKYISWQNSNDPFIPEKNYSIINISFSFKLYFLPSAKKGKKEFIDVLCKEGKTHDTDVYYKEEYFVDEMKSEQRCYLNREEYLRIKKLQNNGLFFVGLILFLSGYSSILYSFTYFDEGDDYFLIKKFISGENDLRAKYKKNDEGPKKVEYLEDDLGEICPEDKKLKLEPDEEETENKLTEVLLEEEQEKENKIPIYIEEDGSKTTDYILYE